MFIAQLAGELQIAVLRNMYTAFSLNRLDHHRAGFLGYRRFQRFHVIVRCIAEPAGKGFVPFLVFRLTCRRQSRERTSMERMLGSDDFNLIWVQFFTVFADQFDGAFVGFGSTVADKYLVHPCHLRQLLNEQHLWLGVV